MAPPLGSKYWLRRNPATGHRPLKFATPEKLWEAACEYFEWAAANPLIEKVLMPTKDGPPKTFDVPKLRAFTQRALCLYIDINSDTYQEYRKRPEFKDVCSRIDDLIFTQKFEGASAGLLQSNIIMRELGLVEKTDVNTTHGGSITSSTRIDVRGLSRDQLTALASIRIPALTHEPITIESTPVPTDSE